MKVRAKVMAFDGLRRIRPGQICEVDDRLIKRDGSGAISKPRWAADIDEPLPIPATTPYPKKLPEMTSSVIKAPQALAVEEAEPVGRSARRPRKLLGSDNVI